MIDIAKLFSDFDGRTCAIVGSGTSLRGFDFSQLNHPGIFTIALNREGFRNRAEYTPDLWFFHDGGIGDWAREQEPRQFKLGIAPSMEAMKREYSYAFYSWWAEEPNLYLWPGLVEPARWGLQKRPLWNYQIKTVAIPALDLAIKMGFRRIALLGVDFYADGDQQYYADDMPKIRKKNNWTNSVGGDMKQRMEAFTTQLAMTDWPGHIVQCSLDSPLTAFSKMPFDEFFRAPGSSEYERFKENYYKIDHFYEDLWHLTHDTVKEEEKVLNVGCGSLRSAQKFPGKMRGVDFNSWLPYMWEQDRLLHDGMVCDAAVMPFKDKEFDVSISSDFLEHVQPDQVDKVLAEISRVSDRGVHIIDLKEQTAFKDSKGRTLHVSGLYTPEAWNGAFRPWVTFIKMTLDGRYLKVQCNFRQVMRD